MLQLGDKPGTCNPDPNGRSIVIQITDQCPQCGQNQIDIQALTWAKVCVSFTCYCLAKVEPTQYPPITRLKFSQPHLVSTMSKCQ